MPLVWANALENAPMASSATAMPARQKTAAIKTRRLKKADFDVDFFFIDGSGVVSLSGGPRDGDQMLGETLEGCQHFFNVNSDYLHRLVSQ